MVLVSLFSTSIYTYQKFLLKRSFYSKEIPNFISKNKALKDLSTLKILFERAYIGYDIFAKRGLNWNELLGAIRADILKQDDTFKTIDFLKLLAKHFKNLPDRHISLYIHHNKKKAHIKRAGYRLFTYYSTLRFRKQKNAFIVLSGPQKGYRLSSIKPYSINKLMKPFINGKLQLEYRMVLIAKKNFPPISSQFQYQGKTKTESIVFNRYKNIRYQKGPVFEIIDGMRNFLRLRSFGYNSQNNTFIQSAKKLRNKKIIIVDVRRNSGGHSIVGSNWIGNLSSLSTTRNTITQLKSELTLQGEINAFWPRVHIYDMNSTAKRKYRKTLARKIKAYQYYKNIKKGKPFLIKRVSPSKKNRPGSATKPYRGKIIVLTDVYCASACESFVSDIKQLPNVLVLGEKTGGIREFVLARPYALKNSRIIVSLPIQHGLHPNPEFQVRESIGHLPDLWVESKNIVRVAKLLAHGVEKGNFKKLFKRKHDYQIEQYQEKK